jgi:hypothetical protein
MTQHQMECEAYGVAFRLGSTSPALLDLAMGELPYGSGSREGSRTTAGISSPEFFLQESETGDSYRLLLDGESLTEWQDLPGVLGRLHGDLMVHIANFAPDFVFVHAGVISWQGHALVFPGPSLAGKSTLISELVCAGAIYYSDEYAVVDDAGWIHPHARDLQMRTPGGLAQSGVPVEKFGGRSGTDPVRAGSVVFCQYAEDAWWSPEPVSSGMAVLEMLQHAIPVQRTPQRVMAVLTRMMAGASAVRTLRGEAADAAQKLLTLASACGGQA